MGLMQKVSKQDNFEWFNNDFELRA
jgi:hypothetical protein